MAHLLVRQKVEDYATWKAAFDTDAGIRASGGSQGGHIFQNTNDPHEVVILLAWDTMDNLRQFAQADDLQQRMQRAGVVGPPAIVFLDLVDSPSA
jgi:heme-degrading monooxygenase HmoA